MPKHDTVDIFFSLLRSGLYGTPVPEAELPDHIDWAAVVALARKHVVYGLIIDSVRLLPERLRPSEEVYAKMNKFARGLLQTNSILDRAAAHLSTFFRQRGIEGVVLKGQGLARYYRMPEMRQCGDIDFYVGKKNYKKAVRICREELSEDKNGYLETEQHFDFVMSGIPVELHRLASTVYSPFKGMRFRRWVVEQLEHSSARRTLTIGNADITLPSYDFDAVFVFYHAWRHFIIDGIGLRQLCDWAMVLHAHGRDIDTERLKENIRSFGMTRGWKLFACIAVDRLGLPEDEMPLYDPAYRKKSEKVLEKIFEGGNFGFYSKKYLGPPPEGFSLSFGLRRLRYIVGYCSSLFSQMPVEATFLFLNRLYFGTLGHLKKLKKTSELSDT